MASNTAVPQRSERAAMLVGKGWVQGVALVMILGFAVMGILAYRTYTASMPQPDKTVASSGEVLFTTEDITAGQQLFLARGLMQYGSIMGHGAYLGPDYTADYLRRAAVFVEEELRRDGVTDPQGELVKEFRTNRYDKATRTLTFTDLQTAAFEANKQHYATFFGENSTKNGLIPQVVTDPKEIHQLTAFFGWTAWAAAAERPGHDYSYTNNWPAEPRVDNGPTADLIVWSVLSLIVLLGGTGALFAVYGRWSSTIGWHSAEAPAISFRQPGEVALTPGQRATAWFFFVIAGLFFVQALLGAAAEHYRADLLSFFGFDLARLLPYNLARTWHVQLSLFWTAAGFLAAGIFLTPFIAGREPKRQATLVYILFGAVVLVVVGSLVSEALSIHGVSWAKGPLFAQQWEYLDLPFVWQVLLTIGLSCGSRSSTAGSESDSRPSPRATCRSCFSTPRLRFPSSTRSGCWPAPTPIRSPISGASGWCTSGSRISWSCSPPSWSPTSSCCWG